MSAVSCQETALAKKGILNLFSFSVTFLPLIRVFLSPRFSPVLILSRWIVRNQNPEYVGAKQKKFAWVIGVILSGTMFVFFNIVNAFSPITGIICLICLIFLFFESAFGICIGCKIYSLLYKEKTSIVRESSVSGKTVSRYSKYPVFNT